MVKEKNQLKITDMQVISKKIRTEIGNETSYEVWQKQRSQQKLSTACECKDWFLTNITDRGGWKVDPPEKGTPMQKFQARTNERKGMNQLFYYAPFGIFIKCWEKKTK